MNYIDRFDAIDDFGTVYTITVYPGRNKAPAGFPPREGLRTYRLNDRRTVVPNISENPIEFRISDTDIILRKI
jgi:hypothetical protein